jgi:magnesium chelatase subunit D
VPDGSASAATAAVAAAIIAVDPIGTGGCVLKVGAGSMRDGWMSLLGRLLPRDARLRQLPLNCPDERMLGGLDIVGTLAAGRPVFEQGILSQADGGLIILPMAERMSAVSAARLTSALDLKELVLERDGFAARLPARFGLIVFDESSGGDERPPAALLDRVAFHLALDNCTAADLICSYERADICLARAQLGAVAIGDDTVEALCAAAVAVGVFSLNASVLAVRVARAAAALACHSVVTAEDAALAAQLVIAPRATRLPVDDQTEEDGEQGQDQDQQPPETGAAEPADETATEGTGQLQDIVVAAVLASMPADLLARLDGSERRTAGAQQSGRSGKLTKSASSGRVQGVRRGRPSSKLRLSILETLRAAAPWQTLRRRCGERAPTAARIEIRSDDFRIKRLKQRAQATTIFVVDASGSSALHRLAEAKGAVELLLADCYIRRDQVALISFGGRGAELLLPPTRSLARAKRNLGSLPGGGGTPLAAGLEAAASLAESLRRKGQSPSVVLLTDGHANLDRNGKPGRGAAEADALEVASVVKASALKALVIDTSQMPQPQSARLAEAMGAKYFPLPRADADGVSRLVRSQQRGKS